MFKSQNLRLLFQPEVGDQIMVRAKLSLYEARGDYQLLVEHMEPSGQGALAKAFELLKQKLHQQGLFDPSAKKALPPHVRHLAIITSATGAAIRDVLTVLARRFPAIKVTILPVAVQGEESAPQIVAALARANRLALDETAEAQGVDFDAILLTRGGGSLEDLWSFNEEAVAKAIAASELPVVSAVGHEIDFTIADLVADVRAPTPSAAAELLSPDQREWMDLLSGYEQLLLSQIRNKLKMLNSEQKNLRARLKHPGSALREYAQRLDDLESRQMSAMGAQLKQRALQLEVCKTRLQQHSPELRFDNLKETVAGLSARLQRTMSANLEHRQLSFKHAAQMLHSVSPLATLVRGYAISTDDKGNIVNSISSVSAGDTLHTQVSDGSITSKVVATKTDTALKDPQMPLLNLEDH